MDPDALALHQVHPAKLAVDVTAGLADTRSPSGCGETGDGFVIFSDAPWLQSFRGGAVAELVLRGQTRPVHGQVVDDPARIGVFMRNVMSAGTPGRQLGLSMPAGQVITDDEAAAVRTVLLLRPAPAG